MIRERDGGDMEKMTVVELTPESFRGYGDVLSVGPGTPMGSSEEFTYWGKVAELEMGPRVSTGYLACNPRAGVLKRLERHLRTPEILVALRGDSLVCMARPSDPGSKCIDGLQAFRVRQGQAFAMAARTWHWAAFPIGKTEAVFLVVFASGTEGADLEFVDLDGPREVQR
jgi:ureidoglycolate hydrolase